MKKLTKGEMERPSYLPPVLKIRSALGAPFGCWYRGRRSRLVFAGAGRWARDCSISVVRSRTEKAVNSGKRTPLMKANKTLRSLPALSGHRLEKNSHYTDDNDAEVLKEHIER